MSPHQEGSFYAIRGAAKAHNRLHFKLRRWFSYPCPGPTDFNGTVVLAPSRPPSAPLRAGLRPALTSAARDSVSEAGPRNGLDQSLQGTFLEVGVSPTRMSGQASAD